MFAWDDKYKLIFSNLGASDKVGVNDVAVSYTHLTLPTILRV